MKLKVLITTGPTNEYIDKVMKITNMSTGETGIILSHQLMKHGCEVTLISTLSVLSHCLAYEYNLLNRLKKVVPIETTADLEKALKKESKKEYDLIIHSAAVADYIPNFAFRLEDLAKEISLLKDKSEENIYKLLKKPKCRVYDGSKISSNEPNLTIKLGLTNKVIDSLRGYFPKAIIYGFKLLENVPKSELINAAKKTIKRTGVNYVVANDLKNINEGKRTMYLVSPAGETKHKINSVESLANLIIKKIAH